MKTLKKHSTFQIFVFVFLFQIFTFFIPDLQAQSIPQNPNKTNAEGKKEGTWTILYDKNWKVIAQPDSAAFYRLITYENGKPKGIVKDFYRSGQVQMEGKLIEEAPKEIKDSLFTFYDEKGNIANYEFYKKGKLDNGMTIPYMEKLLLIQEKTISKEHPNYVTSLNNLAGLYRDQGLYAQAEPLYVEAKEIRAKVLGKEHPNYATSLNSLALLYHNQGLYAQAETLYVEVKEIRAKVLGKEHPNYVTSLNNLALLYYNQGLYTKAEPLYVEAKEIRAKVLGKEHPNYATSLNNLAGLYYNQGLYAQAAPLLVEAKENRAKVLGKEHPDYANSLNNLAMLYQNQGLYAQAEPLHVEAKEITAKVLGKEHPDYATSLNNLAMLYQTQGLHTQAEPLHVEAKEITAKVLGKEHPDYATSLNNLAMLYQNQGLYAQAEPLLVEAKEIKAKVLGKEHPDYANLLNNLADLYSNQGLYAQADPLYVEAKEITAKVLGKEHPNYANYLNNLARLYQNQGFYVKAEPLFLASVQSLMKQLENQMPHLSEQEEELYYETLKRGFTNFHSFVAEEVSKTNRKQLLGELYNLQLTSKALLLNSSAKWKQNIMNSKDQRLIEKYFAWVALKKRLTSLESKGRNAQLDSLEKETEVQEKQLSKLAERFNKISDKKLRTWQEVRASLKQGQAAVEIIRIQKFGIKKTVVDSSDQRLPVYQIKGQTDTIQYLALIVTPQTQNYPDMVFLTNGNELEKQIKFYSNAVKYRAKDKNSYGLYWGKLGAWFKQRKIKKVYFSPDGVYHQINLNTLQNPVTQQYLVDEIDVQIVTNTKDLLIKPTEEFTNQYAILVGNPDFSTLRFNQKTEEVKASAVKDSLQVLTNRSLNWGSVSPLPNTQVEINLIGKALKKQNYEVEVFSGKQATEENIKSAFKPKILHIATHGFFELSKEGDEKGKSNPLTRSGLVLARKDTLLQSENGILTAYESTIMNLEGTELVVLSACETGLGEVMNGEGVYGLQRAFKVAGAKAILMSLWKVDDRTTQELMTLFYEIWLSGKSKQAAFKMAQMKLREKYKVPYYWGCFVMVGE
jgi:CHAT domain-containing protein/antitoxin component YwqK of YwqJK toxin-antitoxin module